VQKFKERTDKRALIYEQVERFFAPLTRPKGNKNIRRIGNAVCEFAAQKSNRASAQQEFFEGHRGVNIPHISQMEGAHPSFGRHNNMAKSIKKLADDISAIDQT